jgi:16S rRNA (cytosine967-C5)-methyltransferase
MTSARLAASRVLVAVERGRTSLAAEVDRARSDLADARDRGFLLELAAGALRWQKALDAVLEARAQRPMADLDPGVRAVLRLGAYQILYLDRVPGHAVVNEAVSTTRAMGSPRAAGFVNAVLRAVARSPGRARLPRRPLDDGRDRAKAIRYLSITLSHPDWLVARWLDRYGFAATETWCQFNNDAAEVAVRAISDAETTALAAELAHLGVAARPSGFVRGAFLLPPGSLGKLSPEVRSTLMVQDEASQIVAHAAGAQPGERLLDVCAAPGGKTMVMSGDMRGEGFVVACDLRPNRVALLADTLARSDSRARVVALDATVALPFGAVFDRVMADVPCSGLGTLRRDPDLKWSRKESDLAPLATIELQMLKNAADAVRPGGALIYATCSSEPDENDGVVDRFLAARPDFVLEPVTMGPALITLIDADRVMDGRGFVRTLPFRDGLDAFFAAALRRRTPPGL